MKRVRHWREISDDPNCSAVQAFLMERLSDTFAGVISDELQFTSSFVSGEDVLDIGVAAHTIERTCASDWTHAVIKKSAKSLVGVDILEEPVRALQERGFDVRLVDATSDDDLGLRFSRVVIGDVIEHVDNPVALLRFAKRHLQPNGKILCSTPNPFFAGRFYSGYRSGWYVPNADHVSWVTPTMALELGHRAGLSLCETWHLRGAGLSFFKRSVIMAVKSLGLSDKECFASAFYYVFE